MGGCGWLGLCSWTQPGYSIFQAASTMSSSRLRPTSKQQPSRLLPSLSSPSDLPPSHSERPSRSEKDQTADVPEESEEEDFMSEKFLQQPVQSSSSNNTKTYSEKRKRKLIQASASQQKKSRAQREVEAREEGLGRNLINPNASSSQPTPQVESHSKAVQMMLKMGFQPGSSLGVSNSTSKNSNINPINVVPKSDRSGIGIAIKSRISATRIPQLLFASKGELKLTEEESVQREAFLVISRTRFDSRKVEGILSKACRTCEELDRRSGLESNIFWLRSRQEDTDHPRLTTTKLDQLIEQDRDHQELDIETIESSNLQEEEERNWLALEPSTRLSYTLAYLRQEYFYCIWCGCQFESQEELDKECPGEEEDDH